MVDGVQAYVIDGVYVRVGPANSPPHRFLGVAKYEPFVLSGVQALREPGDVWFEFGSDTATLVDVLVAEVKEAIEKRGLTNQNKADRL